MHVQHLRFAILDHGLSFIRSGTHKLIVPMAALGKAMCVFINKTKWPRQVREQILALNFNCSRKRRIMEKEKEKSGWRK